MYTQRVKYNNIIIIKYAYCGHWRDYFLIAEPLLIRNNKILIIINNHYYQTDIVIVYRKILSRIKMLHSFSGSAAGVNQHIINNETVWCNFFSIQSRSGENYL